MMEQLTRMINGEEYAAVVYSPGFGAGWSTWGAARADDGRIAQWLLDHYHYDTPEEILAEFSEAPKDVIGRFAYELNGYDDIPKGVVYCTRSEGAVSSEELEKLKQFCVKECGYSSDKYFNGGRNLSIAWIKRGTAYRISEYDGKETIELMGNIHWDMA
jgi:hypothetical protein